MRTINGVELTTSPKEYTGNAAKIKTCSPQRSLFISIGPCRIAPLSYHVRLHLTHLPAKVGDQVHINSFPPRLLIPWRTSPRWFPVGFSWSFHGCAWFFASGWRFPHRLIGFRYQPSYSAISVRRPPPWTSFTGGASAGLSGEPSSPGVSSETPLCSHHVVRASLCRRSCHGHGFATLSSSFFPQA